jgi:predicted AlkP superfamily pyrophosphatase or phosphodiesterase
MYFSDVDDAGHGNSPESPETGKMVKKVDRQIKRLFKGLKKRKIDKKVNLIIVSDHGMASVPQKNSIVLDEMFDKTSAKNIFWVSEIVQIFPKEGKEDEIYNSIKSKLPAQAKIYRKAELPDRYHFKNNRRIAPLLILPEEGWIIVNKERLTRMQENGDISKIKGSHGYDNQLESMRALFIGHGESFKKGYVSAPFQNIQIYNLMCRILNLNPAENDGDFSKVKELLK